jgi:hypothetical protein
VLHRLAQELHAIPASEEEQKISNQDRDGTGSPGTLLLRPQLFRKPVKIDAAKILKAFPVGRNIGAEEIAGERAHEPGDQIFHRANGRAARAEAQRRGEVEAVDVAQRRSLGSLIVKTDVSASGLSSTRRASVTRRRS